MRRESGELDRALVILMGNVDLMSRPFASVEPHAGFTPV
jgi:hypothetical protein